ncbi:hypothetical protein Jiend_15850 [Micromonospora endophytica]|nr:hypothetical protein Jiend_15850 [Micromonospora endophytica]
MDQVVRRWWNGLWGRLARRDVWLVRQTRWKVVARSGDSGTGRTLRWEFDSKAEAQTMVDRLLRAPSPGSWREHATPDPTHDQPSPSPPWPCHSVTLHAEKRQQGCPPAQHKAADRRAHEQRARTVDDL